MPLGSQEWRIATSGRVEGKLPIAAVPAWALALQGGTEVVGSGENSVSEALMLCYIIGIWQGGVLLSFGWVLSQSFCFGNLFHARA